MMACLLSSKHEEKWLKISFVTQPSWHIYFLYIVQHCNFCADRYASSVTLTWNTSCCMELEQLHVNGDPFYQIFLLCIISACFTCPGIFNVLFVFMVLIGAYFFVCSGGECLGCVTVQSG